MTKRPEPRAGAAKARRLAFIGSAGIPNRYGGFEAFLEQCAPLLAEGADSVIVTCDGAMYEDHAPVFEGVERRFIDVSANGGSSILHDLLAFFAVFREATHIVALGVSGGLWFPAFRLLCDLSGKRLIVNVDGLEWRRTKFSRPKRLLLRILDALAQLSAHVVVYDNAALRPFLLKLSLRKAVEIAYAGDHAPRIPSRGRRPGTALTVCRIEPENNIDMLIAGVLASPVARYTIVGNWQASAYGRALRGRWGREERLELLDSIYDLQRLAALREECEVYLHGHSVGGTNPSLVEMLFYDCALLCYDCEFNRETAGGAAGYFQDAASLAQALARLPPRDDGAREQRRARFTRRNIADAYLRAVR